MPGNCGLVLRLAALLAFPSAALAQGTVQPIFVRLPGVPVDDAALDTLRAESGRFAWRPVHPVDFAGPPAYHTAATLETALRELGALHLQDTLRDLDAAAAEAAATGGAGLTNPQLGDIYLYRAIARQKVDPTDGGRAWDDYVRAATVNPERVLDPGRVPPAALDAWNRATVAVQRRARGSVIIQGPPAATISVDARPPVHSPALFAGLPYGEHLVRVEEPGHWPWVTTLPLTAATLEIEVPARPELSLDDAAAAGVAKHAGAAFALVAQPRPGGTESLLELRLVETGTALRRSTVVVVLSAPGALQAALGRVQKQAQSNPADHPGQAPDAARLLLDTKVPLDAANRADAGTQRRRTWVLVAAAVAVAAAAGVVAAVVGRDRNPHSIFSVSADPTGLGR